ncbi:MAG: Histone deacetylase domain protein [Candidatus Bathyarchaeota archaeon BA1]|nr:MAG: Histone deacetylase domain protein [Candidatus Bathyarchaeota archaeon BA1]
MEYYEPWHPESPARVREAYRFLKGKGYEFVEPTPASYEDLLRVHTAEYIEMVRTRSFYDPDSPPYEDIYEYACLSAGGAILTARLNGFSLMRPPGHHAGRSGRALGASSLGFCYFNNLAIAVRSLDKSTLILDIDGHHGNGTQEIFLGDPKVRFVSLHRSPHYPGTGLQSQANCLNFPLHRNTGDELYLKTLEKALSQVDMKGVEVVALSAGFDAHENDPMASLGLNSECYREIGRRIGSLGLPTFATLEGGYNPNDLGRNIYQFLQGLEESSI